MNIISVIHAAEKWDSTLGGPEKDVATIGSIVPLFSNITNGVMAFVGVVLFIVVVMAGFTFLFSGGDAKQLEKAKGTFTNAIIGLAFIAGAYLIINLIGQLTGAKVTEFNLNIK